MGPLVAASSMILLVVLMLSAEAASRAVTSTEDPETPTVPAPTNVLITSYNLNPVLCWEYQDMPQTPTFTVQIKNYGEGWIDSCTNISGHCCNIYEQIKDPEASVWARVKANLGQKGSAYVESEEFVLCQHGKVGPPTPDISVKGDQLIVNVLHPAVVINGEKYGVMYGDESACYTFYYTLYVQKFRSEEVLYTSHAINMEDCDEDGCQFNISVSALDSRYCVSVDGLSEFWAVTTEKSEDVCVSLVHNSRNSRKGESSGFYVNNSKNGEKMAHVFTFLTEDSTWIMVAALVMSSLFVFLIFVYWYMKKNPCKRKSIALPKSLLSVVKNATSETKPESKYTSLVTSCQPAVLENETVVCEEHLSTVALPRDPGTTEHEKLCSEAEPMIPEGNTAVAPDSPPMLIQRGSSSLLSSNQSESCSLTLYHSRSGSDSGLVGSGSSIADSEFLPHNNPETKTPEQEPAPVRKAPTSFGYDKPHVLVDVLVDGGDGKESLIGYRLPTDAKEPS